MQALGGGDREKDFRHEDVAQIARKLAHFDRVANRLVAIKELVESIVQPSNLRLAALDFGISLRLAVLACQLGESCQGHEVGGIGSDNAIECLALNDAVGLARGKPGLDPICLDRLQLAGRQMGHRLAHDIGPVGCHRPLEARPPDWGIVGASLEAGIEQAVGGLEGSGSYGEVSLTEPDAVVVWSKRDGTVEIGAKGLDRRGRPAQFQRKPREVDGQLRGFLAGFVQVLPAFFNQTLAVFEAALLGENRHEQDTQGGSIHAGVVGHLVDHLLGNCQAARGDKKGQALRDRARGERRPGRNLGPRSLGLLVSAACPLADTQQVGRVVASWWHEAKSSVRRRAAMPCRPAAISASISVTAWRIMAALQP